MSEDQPNLFGEELPISKGNNIPKTKPRKSTRKQKDNFLKELQEMDSKPKINTETNNTDWDKDDWKEKVLEMTEGSNENIINNIIDEDEEYKQLQEELKQDIADGLIYDEEPFYIKENKLVVTRYQEQIHANIKNLAKSIIDNKWSQNINPTNIFVAYEVKMLGEYEYTSVVCLSEYGVRFRVVLQEILDKLNKIPFE